MVLADEIIEEVGSRTDMLMEGRLAKFAERMMSAEFFSFDDVAAEAIESIAASKMNSILGALPMCKLPFKKVWMEWPLEAVKNYRVAGRHGPEERAPRRIGYLIEALDDTFQRLAISYAWAHSDATIKAQKSDKIIICPLGHIVDWSGSGWAINGCARPSQPVWLDESVKKSEFKSAITIAKTSVITTIPEFNGFFDEVTNIYGEKASNDFMYEYEKDIRGEIVAVIGALCLLNSKNCTEIEPVNRSKINARRVKRGRKKLITYSTVKIKLGKGDERRVALGGISAAEIRRHIVRGHFKLRKSGVFFWRPYIRGKEEFGEVRRSGYEVDTRAYKQSNLSQHATEDIA